ncbi:MAG TPA: hypothetical protein VIJ54_11950 [Actinomycetes bacterium]
MGTLLHPVGPLSPGAYWFRRTVVGAVVVLLLSAGGWLLSGGGPAKTAGGTPPSSSSTPTVTPTPTPTPTPTVSHTPSATATAAAITLCPDSVIKVVALTDATSYPAGVKPHLSVSVTNTGKVSCKRDIGQAAMSMLIRSGAARVWSSDDCSPGGQPAVNTLKAGQVFTSTVVWTRTISRVGCPTGQPAAAPGTYVLTAKNQTVASAPVTFVLK